MHPVDFKYLQIAPEAVDDYDYDYVTLSYRPVSIDIKNGLVGHVEELWKTSWPVVFLWMVLSTLVTLTCTSGFVEPEWFVLEENLTTPDAGSPGRQGMLAYDHGSVAYALGIFQACQKECGERDSMVCVKFHSGSHPYPFPSVTWQIVCLLYGGGCVLQGCGLFILLMSIFMGSMISKRLIANLVSHIHVFAGLLQTLGLLLFPVVLETEAGHEYCGPGAKAYVPDMCRIGWAYVAATAGTLLTFYCPFLAYFSFYKAFPPRPRSEEYWDF